MSTPSHRPATDALMPMTEIQVRQTRDFVASLEMGSQTYWDMVQIGDELSRELSDHARTGDPLRRRGRGLQPWYEGWRMNTWRIPGESPFGGPSCRRCWCRTSCCRCSSTTRARSRSARSTPCTTRILEPIPVGATVRITTRAIDKFTSSASAVTCATRCS